MPYEQKAPVQIKYRKERKQDKDQLMSKILKSQMFTQIASQKELIRTAIQNVKELTASSRIQSDQQIDTGECPPN